MDVFQTNRFKQFFIKLHKNQLAEINKTIQNIIENPLIGEQKVGDLSWLRVFKFNSLSQRVLIGYSFDQEKLALTFVAIGSHENFYRDIKN